MPIALATPSLDLFDSWAATVAEFGTVHIDGAGLEFGVVPDRAACEEFVAKSRLYADLDAGLPADKVHCDYFWIADDGEVVGFIAFRRMLNDWLRSYGGTSATVCARPAAARASPARH